MLGVFVTIEFRFLGSTEAIVLDDYTLHERVDPDVFESTHQLNIDPPDGEVL